MKKVIYDGSCKLCRITIDKARAADAKGELTFIDFTKEPPAPIDKVHAAREIHVIDGKGIVHHASDGIMELLASNSRWRWAARLGRLPGVHMILRWGYRLVARYRHGHRG